MWSRTFVHDHMKSVVCRAPKTMSGNLYVIFRLWNHSPTSLCRILVCSHHTLMRFWVESSLYASWTLISWLFESLRMHYDYQRMAKPCWQDPLGLETINIIVKKIIPLWTNGLHTVQLKLISAILDGQDIVLLLYHYNTILARGRHAFCEMPSNRYTNFVFLHERSNTKLSQGFPGNEVDIHWTLSICWSSEVNVVILSRKFVDLMMNMVSDKICHPCVVMSMAQLRAIKPSQYFSQPIR